MMNLTSRLAVRIKHLPNGTIDLSNKTRQSQASLGLSDFLPSQDDCSLITKRAKEYVMRFLTSEFSALTKLQQFVPEQEMIHPASKSEFVPMKVLFKDEKYIAETIDILSALIEDASLNGDNQVLQKNKTKTCTCR